MSRFEEHGEGERGWRREPLSGAGRARREAMLLDMRRLVIRRRRVRTGLRLGVAAALVLGLGLAAVFLPPGHSRNQVALPLPAERRRDDDDIAQRIPPLASMRFELVGDDLGVLERSRIGATTLDPAILIGDDELLSLLAAANHPAGLIRTGGKAILAPDVLESPAGEPGEGGDG